MERIFADPKDSYIAILETEVLNLKERISNQEDFHEILTLQYNQTIENYNKRFKRLEENVINIENGFIVKNRDN